MKLHPNGSTASTFREVGKSIRLRPLRATSTGEEVASYGDYVNSVKERMQVAHDLARKHLGWNALWMKESYDAKKNLNQHNRGDLVWYATESK